MSDQELHETGVSFEGSIRQLELVAAALSHPECEHKWECRLKLKESHGLGYVYLHTNFEGVPGNLGMRKYPNKNNHFGPEDYHLGVDKAVELLIKHRT